MTFFDNQANHNIVGSSTAANAHYEEGRRSTPFSDIGIASIDVFDTNTRGVNDNDNMMEHRIGRMRNNIIDGTSDHDNDSCFPNDDMSQFDLKSLNSYDALEDIDLMSNASSFPPQEHSQQQLNHYTPIIDSDIPATIYSTDEELARQLQVEEDESAQHHHQCHDTPTTTTTTTTSSSYRKSQKNNNNRPSSPPLYKRNKSWLDNLIGEPFPQEMRKNYARSDSSQTGCKRAKAAEFTTSLPSHYYSTRLKLSILLMESYRYNHETHMTQIPVWCLTA